MAGRLPSLLRYFNPLAPRGARHCLREHFSGAKVDFNPLAPRGARHYS